MNRTLTLYVDYSKGHTGRKGKNVTLGNKMLFIGMIKGISNSQANELRESKILKSRAESALIEAEQMASCSELQGTFIFPKEHSHNSHKLPGERSRGNCCV